MVTMWLDEEVSSGIVIRETGGLRQTGHKIEASTGYTVSQLGWPTLNDFLIRG